MDRFRLLKDYIQSKFSAIWRTIAIEHLLRYSLITLVTLNLVIVGVIAIELTRQTQEQRISELQEERSLSVANKVRSRLDDLQKELSYLQKIRSLTEIDPTIQHRLLEGLTRQNDAYETIAIINEKGNVLTAIAPYSSADPIDVVRSSIAKQEITTAIQKQTLYSQRITFDEDLQVPVMTLVLPLQNLNGQPQGILVATINLNFLVFIVAQVQIGQTGYVYILDEDNRVIVKQLTAEEAYKEMKLAPLNNPSLITTLNTQIAGSVTIYQGFRNLPVFGSSAFVYGVNWRVIVELPTSEVYAPLRRLVVVILLVLVIAIFISTLLSIKIAQILVSPLEILTQAANEISNGSFCTRLTFKQDNEWGVLANAFNSMNDEIQFSFQKMEVKNAEISDALSKLQNTQLQLVHNEKMSSLGQLVAGIAHEINNPISFIYGNLIYTESYAENLLDAIAMYESAYPDPDRAIAEKLEEIDIDFIKKDFPKLLKSIQMGSNRVRDIVDSLRNFSRLDEANMKESNIHEGIDNTLVILQNQIKYSGDRKAIEIVKNYEDLPLIECYPAQLNQVFMNLLNNAIDALEPFRHSGGERSPQIFISTSQEELGNIVIRIADNGSGIPDEIKQRIFDPFFTTKPIGQGTGLGLSISYQIITQTHNGTLKCDSNVGEGTEFKITIPDRIVQAGENMG